ncbi:sodA [Cronobacter dublinensis 582]|nr:sodA [Cronobacter dublinensis 582]
MAACVVAQNGFLVSRNLIQFGDQLFNRQVRQFRQAFQRRVGVVDVSLVMFGVMDFHRLLVEMRFQGVVSVRQGWQCIAHVHHLHYCRAAEVLTPRKQWVHYS